MAKKEVEVTFRTITPLWTGDAWQNNSGIRPSSLIGSLRFWFEVLMYFGGVLKKEDFDTKKGRFEKEVSGEKLKEHIRKNGRNARGIIKYLVDEQQIPISSVIFGTTGWKSLVEIKGIEPIDDYCFGNRLNLPSRICINKETYEIKENENCPKGGNNDWSFFYFPNPYFWGKFKVKFLVEESILEPIFYPLLNFMDKYGFWGGKWNIGYGRLRIENIDRNNQEFKLSEIFERLENISWNNLIEEKDFEIFNRVLQRENRNNSTNCKNYWKLKNEFKKKVKMLINNKLILIRRPEIRTSTEDYEKIIRRFLVYKAIFRACLRHICEEENGSKSKFQSECLDKQKRLMKDKENKEIKCKIDDDKMEKFKCKEIDEWRIFRHKLLGEQQEGSKILPYIGEENDQLVGKFLSIAGLLNLERELRVKKDE